MRHDGAVGVLAHASSRTYGADNVLVDPRDGSTCAFSPGKIPDITIFDKSPDGLHVLIDGKVVNLITAGTPMCDLPRAAAVPFAGTAEKVISKSRGLPAFERPPGNTSRFSRINNTGSRVAVHAEYAGAMQQGHEVIVALFEVTGAAHHEIVEFVDRLSAAHANKLPLDLAGALWNATTFKSYVAMHCSMAIHKAAASELRRNLRTNKPAAKGSPHQKARKGPSPNATAAARMATVGVAGLA